MTAPSAFPWPKTPMRTGGSLNTALHTAVRAPCPALLPFAQSHWQPLHWLPFLPPSHGTLERCVFEGAARCSSSSSMACLGDSPALVPASPPCTCTTPKATDQADCPSPFATERGQAFRDHATLRWQVRIPCSPCRAAPHACASCQHQHRCLPKLTWCQAGVCAVPNLSVWSVLGTCALTHAPCLIPAAEEADCLVVFMSPCRRCKRLVQPSRSMGCTRTSRASMSSHGVSQLLSSPDTLPCCKCLPLTPGNLS